MRRLRIAYVTTYDATDVNNRSGLGYYIAKTLQKHVGDLEYIGGLGIKKFTRNYLKERYNRYVAHEEFHRERTKLVGKHFARQIEQRIKGKAIDLIFSPGTTTVAYLDVNAPIAFWTDATFASMVGYYFKNVCPMSFRDGMKMEKLALEKSVLAAYSSEWASSSALKDYGISPDKVVTVPFGANIDPPLGVSPKRLEKGEPVKLLFVGRDWARKGGLAAMEAFRALRKMGIHASLTIVGADPGISETGIRIYPFLDKNNVEDRTLLLNLYSESNFFILPSREDATPHVFCEASAFGLPILATDTGGVSTIVKNGVNGFLFPVEASGEEYALRIKEITMGGQYSALSVLARRRYEEVLNWDVAGTTLRSHIEERI